MLDYTATGTYVLVVTLATVFVMILVARQQRAQNDIAIWLISGLVGILLGAAGAAAIVQGMGYELAESFHVQQVVESPDTGDEDEGGEGGGEGGGEHGDTSGDREARDGLGGSGARGGGRSPSSKRELTTLVRKLDLLTGDIALSLSDEQGAALAEILSDLVSRETLTDSEASVVNESILALFGDDQRAKQEAVGLPVRRGGRGGGPGAGDGGGEQAEDANPFAEEGNAAALNSLLGRFGEPTAEKPASAPDSTGGESEEPVTEEPDGKDAAASGVRE